MFADFQNMIKGKIGSTASKQPSSADQSKIPQKYAINNKQIQEIKLLSEGSFGFIWLAEDVQTKQKYALKRVICMTQDRLKLAKKELQLMKLFPKSKNLVEFFGGQTIRLKSGHGESITIVILMELCPNGTLFDLLEKHENKGFSQKQLLLILHSVVTGVISIHNAGYYHQDIKIENVLIGQDNSFKLCDFGSCSNRVVDFSQINKSEYNLIKEQIQSITTPMYRPPEIVDPYLQYKISHKVDVWMLGCVLYTLCYFTHPFLDSNAIGIANGIYRFAKYPSQTKYEVSQKIKDLIRHLLTPNPFFRPDAGEILSIINSWNTLAAIPLNKQAQRRKREEIERQVELQKLNKKVVDYDGDIPIQKLMELQNKLKHKVEEQKASTFVHSKDVKKIMGGPNNLSNQKSVKNAQTLPQKSLDSNDFWSSKSLAPPQNNFQASKTKPQFKLPQQSNSFDAFYNFFPVQNSTKTQNLQTSASNNANFAQFFSQPEQKDVYKAKISKAKQQNLLDL